MENLLKSMNLAKLQEEFERIKSNSDKFEHSDAMLDLIVEEAKKKPDFQRFRRQFIFERKKKV